MKFALKMLQNRPGPDIFVQKISFYPARRAGRQGEEDRRQAGREPGGGRGDPRIRVSFLPREGEEKPASGGRLFFFPKSACDSSEWELTEEGVPLSCHSCTIYMSN